MGGSRSVLIEIFFFFEQFLAAQVNQQTGNPSSGLPRFAGHWGNKEPV